MPLFSLKRDWKRVSLALVLVILLLIIAQATHPVVPSEDAYITFRFARHLAEGQGLVWNLGEDPVEGSTEFLWTVLLAGVYRLSGSMEMAAWILSLLAGGATAILLGLLAYGWGRRQIITLVLAAGASAAGPAAYYVRFGFATNLFSLFILLSFLAQTILIFYRQGDRLRKYATILLPVSLFLLCLTRPEGVLYGLLVLVITWYLLPSQERKPFVRNVLIFLILPGLIYFVWRWFYFGYPLPNTFYVKSGPEIIHLKYIWDIYGMFRFLAPLLLLFGSALMIDKRERASQVFFLFLPAFLFPWFYLLIEQTQNIGFRFQYTVYPLFLLAAAYALGVLAPHDMAQLRWHDIRRQMPFLAGLLIGIFALAVPLNNPTFLEVLALALIFLKWAERWRPAIKTNITLANMRFVFLLVLALFTIRESYLLASSFYQTQFDDRRAIGLALQPYADKGYTIVASEAGWIPYFSRWRAVDPFGLTDEHIAHQGLSFDYLDTVQPDIIMYHDVTNPNPPRWTEMVTMLNNYAKARGYELVAIIERKGPKDVHIY
ncbi:MAG: hypothetical protein GXP38_08145, partial [Chloroflexi bacterium]|nr:hypothetical protein [Chloroflexota bacterium]